MGGAPAAHEGSVTYGRMAATGVAVGLLGFVLGRYGAPRRVVERDRIVTTEVEAKRDETRTAESTTSAREQATRTIVRYVYRDNGTIAERTETAEAVDKSAAASARSAEQVRAETREVARVEYRERLVDRTGPSWMVGARIRSDLLAGGGATPAAGITLDRRIAGPFWATAAADSDRRISVGVKVEF